MISATTKWQALSLPCFSQLTERLATILSTHTFEKYVVKDKVEVTESDPKDNNLSKDQEVCQEKATSN